MCQWTQREYGCGHVRYVAAVWCASYCRRKQRCSISIAHFESRKNEKCASCRPRRVTPHHAVYLCNIYKYLREKHPEQDWDAIGKLVELETEPEAGETKDKERRDRKDKSRRDRREKTDSDQHKRTRIK